MNRPHAPLQPLHTTAIGSMPHATAADAVAQVRATQRLPAWPQLSLKSAAAPMLWEVVAGLPGIAVTQAGTLRLPAGFGMAMVASAPPPAPPALPVLQACAGAETPLKGQVAGPVTLAMNSVLADGRPAIEDTAACEALAGLVARVAVSQSAALQGGLLLLDEPDLHRGLSRRGLGAERCRALLNTPLMAVSGHVGVHTCAEPDLDFLTALPFDVLSFDAYRHGGDLPPEPLARFLLRGGWVAWGIVPSQADALAAADEQALASRLEAVWARLAAGGVSARRLWAQALITPSCGLGLLSIAEAGRALQLIDRVAHLLKAQAASATAAAPVPA